MPETTALHRRILDSGDPVGQGPAVVPGSPRAMMAQVDGLLEELYAVAGRLERARAALESASVRASPG